MPPCHKQGNQSSDISSYALAALPSLSAPSPPFSGAGCGESSPGLGQDEHSDVTASQFDDEIDYHKAGCVSSSPHPDAGRNAEGSSPRGRADGGSKSVDEATASLKRSGSEESPGGAAISTGSSVRGSCLALGNSSLSHKTGATGTEKPPSNPAPPPVPKTPPYHRGTVVQKQRTRGAPKEGTSTTRGAGRRGRERSRENENGNSRRTTSPTISDPKALVPLLQGLADYGPSDWVCAKVFPPQSCQSPEEWLQRIERWLDDKDCWTHVDSWGTERLHTLSYRYAGIVDFLEGSDGTFMTLRSSTAWFKGKLTDGSVPVIFFGVSVEPVALRHAENDGNPLWFRILEVRNYLYETEETSFTYRLVMCREGSTEEKARRAEAKYFVYVETYDSVKMGTDPARASCIIVRRTDEVMRAGGSTHKRLEISAMPPVHEEDRFG